MKDISSIDDFQRTMDDTFHVFALSIAGIKSTLQYVSALNPSVRESIMPGLLQQLAMIKVAYDSFADRYGLDRLEKL